MLIASSIQSTVCLPSRICVPPLVSRSLVQRGLRTLVHRSSTVTSKSWPTRVRRQALPATSASAAPQGAQQFLRELYPATPVVEQGALQVSELHKIAYAVYGNPEGIPAVVVHGGPGAGCWPNHARFFNPALYRIVLIDQRGCGASSPRGCLVDNTTHALVSDLEAVRQHLGISQWLLLGGSWGVTLALTYAQRHADRVLGLVLRGVCLMRPLETAWMYGGGAGMLQPLAWHSFVQHVSPPFGGGAPPQDVLLAYYSRLLSSDPAVRDAAAQAWMRWEMAVAFSHNHELYHWDGKEWFAEALPPPAPAPPAPPPKSSINKAAAARGSKVVPPAPSARGSKPSTKLPAFKARTPQPAPSTVPPPSPMAADGELFPHRLASAPDDQVAHIPVDLAQRAAKYRGDKQMPSSAAQALLECHYSLHHAFLQPALAAAAATAAPSSSSSSIRVESSSGHVASSHQSANASSSKHVATASHWSSPLLEADALAALRVRRVPCIAVQGQRDLVCPPGTAYELHRAWPEMVLRMVPDAGHSMYDPGIRHELLEAMDRLAKSILTSQA